VKFEPRPANDFLDFMHAYHARCEARVPAIRAVAAKWTFEDLIPGLSDFDTRFIVADGMRVPDWQRMALEVGRVHTEMCREFPHWARNLEHTPGVNLTVSELCDPRLFYSEFQQWTFYAGDAAAIAHVRGELAKHAWSPRDELHHLKKFAAFCGPYQRGIDPAVNLGPFEGKYPLHSRFMHYFAPPVQAAVSLALKQNMPGKLDALRKARDLFPHREVIDLILATLDEHYETPELYEEPRLTRLERELEAYLDAAWESLAPHVSLVRPERGDRSAEVRRKVAAVPVDPVHGFFESAKFGRLLKGRLLFYAESIPWFDTAWLIRNELGRIVVSFYATPLSIYGQVRFGEKLGPGPVLDRLTGGLISAEERDAMNRFAAVASEPIAPGKEREQSRRVAEVFDVVTPVTEALGADLLQRWTEVPNPSLSGTPGRG
jgi:hypothetical protein